MTVTLEANGSVQLKARSEIVSIGAGVVINNVSLPGAGEYDIAGIQADVRPAGNALAYFVYTEELLTIYLDTPALEVTDLSNAENCNVFILDLRSDSSTDTVKVLIKRLEPSYVVLIGATPEVLTEIGLPTQTGTLKVTRSGLPLEGTTILTRE